MISLPSTPNLDFSTGAWILVLLGLCVLLYKDAANPLNRFPGPYLARWTSYYQAYFEIVKDGGWLEHLEELHRKYGASLLNPKGICRSLPLGVVVRVGPNEVCCHSFIQTNFRSLTRVSSCISAILWPTEISIPMLNLQKTQSFTVLLSNLKLCLCKPTLGRCLLGNL